MKTTIRLLLLLTGTAWGGKALAQTPTLEFAAGAGNPTGNGSTTNAQVITFQNNPGNPSSNTFTGYTPVTTATFTLDPQVYTNGVVFGRIPGSNGSSPIAGPLFIPISARGGVPNIDANYTAASGIAGGINIDINRGVSLYTDVSPVAATATASTRYRYADLTITFSQPVVNPVVHVSGMGQDNGDSGYTTELDLLTANVTLSKLSGSPGLKVQPTQILNDATVKPTAGIATSTANGSVLVTTPAGGITSLKFGVYLRTGTTVTELNQGNSPGDNWVLSLSELTPPTAVTGYVYEDVNYGGGTGRPRATSGAVARPGATVELYTSTGNFVATTTTNASGQYTFNVPASTYQVRVVNSTVTSSRPGTAVGLLPVQTYNGTTSRVGGENPALTDAPARSGTQTLADLSTSTTTPESIALLTVAGTPTTGPDFGFNFDLVVNTRNAGQGSLRQFIINSNTLTNAGLNQVAASSGGPDPAAGVETSLFMIPDGQAHNGLLAAASGGPSADPGFTSVTVGGVAQRFASIALATALNPITDTFTVIDGTTQTQNIGNTNTTTLGAGGTVGTAGTAFGLLSGPEVQLQGTRAFAGLSLAANNVTVRGLSIYGFTNNISVGADYTSALIEQNVLGASATSFTDPGASARTSQQGVYLANSDNGAVRNNLIGFNGGVGVWAYGDGNGANNNTISGNEIRGNGQETSADGEGLELQGASTGNTVTGNLIAANLGHGIDSFGNTIGGNTLTGNTIAGNGLGVVAASGVEGSGIRVYGATNKTTITGNVLSGNNGSGVLVAATANNVTISQNSAFGNTRLGIDLLSTADGAITATTYNGATGSDPNVSLNDNGDTDTGANGVFNFPVLTSATFVGNNLVLQGYARPGSVIELFAASAAPNGVAANEGFGQGQTYLGTFIEGSAADSNPSAGTYSGSINGRVQGTDATNLFTFTIPISSLGSLATGTIVLTSTATLANATSEFSGNIAVRPTANNDFATTTVGTPVTFAVTANDTPGNLDNTTIDLDPNTAGIQTSYTVAGQGTFTTVGVAAGQVKFTPINNLFTGTVTISYVVSTTSSPGLVSNQASLSVYVVPSLDLATTVASSPATGPVASSSAVTYTVTSTNNSAFTANNVDATLQLPASLTSNGGTVTINSPTGSGTYNNTTGVVTFAPTALAPTTSVTYTVAVSKVPTSGAIAATSTITSTGNGQEPNTNNNVATTSLAITPLYDVTTALTGPVNAAGTAVAVVAGSLVTYAVQTANAASATSAAPNVVQTVSFDGDLTTNGLFISNGGTAAYNTTAQQTIVTFPALLSLAPGQSVLNTISFAAPGSAYNATATVMANANNTGDTGAGNNTSATLATSVKNGAGGPTNVSTTISTDKTQGNAGDIILLTVTTANAGPSEATNVVQQVQLPVGLSNVTFPNANGSYDASSGLVTFNTLASLGSGSSNGTLLAGPATANPNAFKVQFGAPATGIVLATAFVTADNNDLVLADNVAEVKVNVNSLADLATEVEGPITATVGQTVTYSIVTSNLSATSASSVLTRVQLPPNLGPGSVLFGGPATGTYDNTTGVVTFNFSNGVPAGSRLTNTVAFTMPASTITDPAGTVAGSNMLAVTANVRTATPENNVANNTAMVATTIVPTADVRVSLSGPSTTLVGSPATYVVTITNDGAATVASVFPTLSLPAGLASNGGVVTISGGGTYDNTTGLVTFPTLTNLANGSSNSNTVTVTVPDVSAFTPVAQVQVSAATIDRDLSNNRAQLTAYPATPTTPTADLSATLAITTGSATPDPNTLITLTATFSNASGSTSSQVVPRLTLPAGLTTNTSNSVTISNGGSYDNATGLVTWATVPTLESGASLTGPYTISFIAPSGGSATATAYVASSTSDAAPTNNTAAITLNVNQQTDISTTVSLQEGNVPILPGSRVTYSVVTTNVGPSPAVNDVTQKIILPPGLDLSTLSYPAGSTISGRTITLPIIKGLGVGSVVNYVSFNAPSASYSIAGQVSMVDDLEIINDIAPTNTTVNRAPVAYNVVNTLQSPQGSSASALLLSPLVANDADANNTFSYRVTTLPNPATGVLTFNGVPVAINTTTYSSDDVKSFYFNPIGTVSDPTAYIGNAFFSYVAIDNFGAASAPALYTIVVGKDNASQYTQLDYPTSKVYEDGEVLANVIDSNNARYNSAGKIYNDANGTIVATDGSVSNGLTSAVAASSSDAALLADNGLALNTNTGQITVADHTKLPTGTVSFYVTTTDANGGINTALVNLRINIPLPVVLTAFTAQAVANRDALLNWSTASEAHNDHFEVERSFDGTTFKQIGKVAGHGTTSLASAYTFTDAGIGRQATGSVYYRLRQVDVDGKATYSPQRTISFLPVAKVSLGLFPNPVASGTTLDLSQLPATGTYQAQLLDATGRSVRTWQLAGGQPQPLDLHAVASGSYLLVVSGTQSDGSPLRQALRLTKE